MFEYYDPQKARTRGSSVIDDECLRERMKDGYLIFLTHQLEKALYDLEVTRASPKRRDPYSLYLDGYFEFQEPGPFDAELTPTPPSTKEPNTPADNETSNPFVSVRDDNEKQQYSDQFVDDGRHESKITPLCLTAVRNGCISRKNRQTDEMSVHRMLRRSLTSDSDVLYELDSSGRKKVPLLRHRRKASKRK